jgi:hypothetical protein
LFAPDRLRGIAEGGLDAELGYLQLAVRLSYGQSPSFQERYWRSGRDRLLPMLALGGWGYGWTRGPTDISLFTWQAFAAVPVATSGTGDFSWESRSSLDLGGALRAIGLHRLRDDRTVDLGVFDTALRRYGDGRLLSIAIDVLAFQTRPVKDGWLAQAAIGMSALRLTPAPHPEDQPSPGQAVPAARLGIGYQGWLTGEVRLATFHRIDPSGSAIDRGGVGEMLVALPVGLRWVVSASAAYVVAKRVRVGTNLDPEAPKFHDWLFPRRLAAKVDLVLGAGWRLGAHAYAEASDRDDALLFPSSSPRSRTTLAAGLALRWIP